MEPYFSLILPIYNVAPYLERCIDSILSQSFKDYEIILVDDGSTDDSPLICDAYVDRFSNVRVIHKVNGGLASARNAGFELAEGKYVWWIDSDDWIESGALEQLHSISCENMPDIVKFHYFRVEKETSEIVCNAEPGVYLGEDVADKLLQKAFYATSKYLLSACFHIYRRSFLKRTNISFVSERIVGSEDYLFNLSVLPMAHSVCVLPNALYSYYLREGSLTQTYKTDLLERYECLYDMLAQVYKAADVWERHQKGMKFFYVWHLVRGTCMTQEYQELPGHTFRDGRRNVKKLLRSIKLRKALSGCDMGKLTQKQQMMLLAMKLRMESLFYYLFVIKPKVAN